MRTWVMPPWVEGQDEAARERGWADLMNYKGGQRLGLRVTWGNTYRVVTDEQKANLFTLKDLDTGKEYIIDKEELGHWLRYA